MKKCKMVFTIFLVSFYMRSSEFFVVNFSWILKWWIVIFYDTVLILDTDRSVGLHNLQSQSLLAKFFSVVAQSPCF